jgi:hypothetical protein
MMNITGNLEAAAAAGRAGLGADAAGTARSPAGASAQHDFERPMAQAVHHELFTEALLAAAHSRLELISRSAPYHVIALSAAGVSLLTEIEPPAVERFAAARKSAGILGRNARTANDGRPERVQSDTS